MAAVLSTLARLGHRALFAVLDVVLPPRCPVCRDIVDADDRFCLECWRRLTFIAAPWCACCGVPFEIDRGPDARCGACLLKAPRYTAARAALVYDGSARTVLLSFKHGDRQYLARIMAPQLIRAGADWLGPHALLVPVPLHRWRLWWRGFNQAAVIAAAMARWTATPVLVDGLVRVRATTSSRGLGRARRAANVRSAFRVRRGAAIAGRDIVLVDDVLTTGATVDACTRMLLRGGARSVRVLTWARVVHDVT